MGKHLRSRSDAARLGFRMSDDHPSPLCAPFTSNSQRRHLGGKMVGPDGGLLGSVPRKETVCPSVRTSAGYGWILDGDRSGRAEQVRPPDMGVLFAFREQLRWEAVVLTFVFVARSIWSVSIWLSFANAQPESRGHVASSQAPRHLPVRTRKEGSTSGRVPAGRRRKSFGR